MLAERLKGSRFTFRGWSGRLFRTGDKSGSITPSLLSIFLKGRAPLESLENPGFSLKDFDLLEAIGNMVVVGVEEITPGKTKVMALALEKKEFLFYFFLGLKNVTPRLSLKDFKSQIKFAR